MYSCMYMELSLVLMYAGVYVAHGQVYCACSGIRFKEHLSILPGGVLQEIPKCKTEPEVVNICKFYHHMTSMVAARLACSLSCSLKSSIPQKETHYQVLLLQWH